MIDDFSFEMLPADPERTGKRVHILRGIYAGHMGTYIGQCQTHVGIRELVNVDNVGEVFFENEDLGFPI